jgi:hypothetical protein
MAEHVISSLFIMIFIVVFKGEVVTIDPLGNFAHCICFTLRNELRPPFKIYIPGGGRK